MAPVSAWTMKAVSAAEPSVCIQLTSRGTLRKRNHFVPLTAAVRSSIQSSGARTAVSTSCCRFDFAATSARHLARDDRIQPRLDAIDVRSRCRPRIARNLGIGAGVGHVANGVELVEYQVAVLD